MAMLSTSCTTPSRVLDHRGVVRDEQYGRVARQRSEVREDARHRLAVEVARRLVEDQQRRPGRKDACDRDALALSTREQLALVADPRLVVEIVRERELGGFAHARIVPGEPYAMFSATVPGSRTACWGT